MLNSEKIKEDLCDELKSADINVLEEVTSTNTILKEKGRNEKEWCTVISSSQTAGRGRLGRNFYSPRNTGVYLSVLLKPKAETDKAVLITTAAAVAVTRALERLGCENPQIKWVNDIFVNGKKVCGILTESVINAESKKLDFAVLGVGINLFEPEGGFPVEIENIAGAVFKKPANNLRNRFVALFLNEFFVLYKELSFKNHLDEYRKKSLVLGKNINVIQGEKTESAKAVGIDDNCNLIAQFPDGTVKKLYSGEISVKLI
ncbi:MAG: biotin--[acetyl-CoA-carboxylase] ligase [Acutalibacteraceae bacterium]